MGTGVKPKYKRGRFPVPSELKQLMKRYGEAPGSRKRAGEAIGRSAAHVGKLVAGVERVSPDTLERIKTALAGNPMDKHVAITITDPKSDPLVLELLRKFDGSAHRARFAAGLSESHWYNLRRGAKVNTKTREKIEAALRSPLSSFDIAGAALSPAVPTVMIGNGSSNGSKPRQIHKSKFDKTDPPLIKELVQKFGSRNAAALAVGYASQEMLNLISAGKRQLTPDMEAKMRAALEGRPLPQPGSAVDELDRFTLGVALVICQGAPAFERVYDTAMAMDLRWMFKVAKGALWIGFAKYPTSEKAAIFKRVCMRDAVLIACP